jgi:hypothetical protein
MKAIVKTQMARREPTRKRPCGPGARARFAERLSKRYSYDLLVAEVGEMNPDELHRRTGLRMPMLLHGVLLKHPAPQLCNRRINWALASQQRP